jgi:DNA invertase Pin-like site-specific DNA recombinase
MRKFAIAAASVALAATMAIGFSSSAAFAASKVDCDAVMSALSGGQKPKEVAKDMKISVSSVYRCKRHAKEAAKAETKTNTGMAKGRAAESAAPSPSETK